MRKISFLSAAVLAGVFSIVGSAQAANLLTNGSLDDIGPNVGIQLNSPNNWVGEGSRAISGAFTDFLSSEPWSGPAPTPVTASDQGIFFKAFTGGPVNGATTGHLSQDVVATPGVTYTLSAWAGGEANFLATRAELALEFLDSNFQLIPGSGSVLNLTANGLLTPNGQAFQYKNYVVSSTAPVDAAGARVRISMIEGVNNPLGGGQAFVADDFSLVVPEPTTLSAIAFAGIAALKRRRA